MKNIKPVTLIILTLILMLSCNKQEPQPADLSQSLVAWAVGSAHNGYGTVLRTTDAGATWVRQGNPIQFADISFSHVYPIDENTALLGGYNPSNELYLFKTVDGGQTWTRKGEQLGMGAICGFAPVKEKQLLACGFIEENADKVPAIFQSLDNGDTWSLLVTDASRKAAFYEAIVADRQGNIVAMGGGTGGIFIRSSDFGTSWQKGVIGSPEETIGSVIDASAVNETSTLFAAGTEEMLSINRSTDYGKTWTQVFRHDNLHMNGIHALNNNNIWVAGDDMLMYHSADNGQTWQLQPKVEMSSSDGVSQHILMGVRFHANGQIGCMCGYGLDPQNNQIGIMIRTSDGGKNWSKVTLPLVGGLRRVFFVSTNSRI